MDTAWEPSFDGLPPLIEHIPGVAFRLSHDGGAWRTWYVTGAISRLGYSADEFLNGEKQWLHLVHPDDRVPVMKRVRDCESEGVDSFELRYRAAKRNGDIVPVVEHNTVFRDRDGGILCQDKILILPGPGGGEDPGADERSRRAYEAVLDNVDSYIFVVRPGDGAVVFANRAFRDAFGEDCVGAHAPALLGTAYGGIAGTGTGTKAGSNAYPEFFCEKSGKWLAVSEETIPWVNGEPARLVNCYDVTAKKLFADALANSSQAKSHFLARTSHEIRTPMNAIIGMAELILRENAGGLVAGHARNIRQAGANLLGVVNDILDFSKIESGRMEIVPVSYSLSSLLNDVISMMRVRMAEKSLLFTANIDARLPDRLRGDEVRIRQILINLLGNAVKFTRSGSVALEVVGSVDKAANRVGLSLRVADTGVGIRREDLDGLFTDFVQAGPGARSGTEGSGLGLSISKSLAVAMGGDILVESRYGSGSSFTAVLPQEFESPDPLAEVENAGDLRVLVYEPRKRYAESLSRTFRNLGVECHVATDREMYADRLRERVYTHVFVSDPLYRSATTLHDKLRLASSFVALGGCEPSAAKEARSLDMPAQAMSVARVLGGGPDDEAPEPSVVGFVAPEARILVVDDSHLNLQVAAGLMEPYRMRIDTCMSGEEALELVRREQYDLVFMDHLMPEMDGVEACRAIRSLGGERFRRLPIVALTANAVSGMREMFLQNGMNDFVAKPIDMPALAAALERWIPPAKLRPAGPPSEERPGTGLRVPGLDERRGLENIGGDMERYLGILALFCDEKDGMEARLRECLAKGDAENFTVHVHSLKGACASIGAAPLAERAAVLEDAGRAGDMEAAAAGLEGVLEGVSALVEKIRAALERV